MGLLVPVVEPAVLGYVSVIFFHPPFVQSASFESVETTLGGLELPNDLGRVLTGERDGFGEDGRRRQVLDDLVDHVTVTLGEWGDFVSEHNSAFL